MYISLFLYIHNRAATPANDLSDEFKICCSQLISKEAGWQHKLCDGSKEDYHVGGLVIELERCPHTSCGSQFHMNPLKNIAHQDIVHRSVIVYSCGVCRGGVCNRRDITLTYLTESWWPSWFQSGDESKAWPRIHD